MFNKSTIAEIAAVARNSSMEPAALLAVAEIESGGLAYAEIAGRREPLIRFEGHYFDLRLAGMKREQARLANLAHPKAGKIANPLTQAGRWRMLERAASIDRAAAYESTSWGLGQVMGAHWKMLGFASVEEMVGEARSGAAGQARLMAGYIAATGIDKALARRDWRAFARAYNGPAYQKNGYHTKLERAWRRYGGANGADGAYELLRFGASGPQVSALQGQLVARGYKLAVDGLFGNATRNAVKDFQRRSGLLADGVVGPATRLALDGPATGKPAQKGFIAALRGMVWRDQ